MICEQTDFMFPLLADVYYPHITQGAYNEVKKEWIFDRSIACHAVSYQGQNKEEIRLDSFLQYDAQLNARSSSDLRTDISGTNHAVTNILVTNIRTANGELVYRETAGPRAGKGTMYEIAMLEPFVGAFGSIDYYVMLFRRTENQAVGE